MYPNIENSALTAQTTRVSNPVRSLCFRTLTSIFDSENAFASGGPLYICVFNPSIKSTFSMSNIQVGYLNQQSMRTSQGFYFLFIPTVYIPYTPSHHE